MVGREWMELLGADEKNFLVEIVCLSCNRRKRLRLGREAVGRWIFKKEMIQDVFPELNDDLRENMMSGTCGDCFDSYFKV